MSAGETRKYFGKYRGMVINNVDPMQQGRLQVQVPDVLGLNSLNWAMPCVPFAGRQAGWWAIPTIGTGVWVEFEQGDPDFPIWAGCWYANATEPPALALAGLPASPSVVVQTQGQQTLMLSDVPGPTGGILLKTLAGALISISEAGITISNGQGATIMLTGPTVSVNGTALVIT
jgi:Type VI secretion system/phage-baseplate injector OB domain